MTTEELRVIRAAMDRLTLTAEDEDDAVLVESLIARAEAAEAKLEEVERERNARRNAEARVKALEGALRRLRLAVTNVPWMSGGAEFAELNAALQDSTTALAGRKP